MRKRELIIGLAIIAAALFVVLQINTGGIMAADPPHGSANSIYCSNCHSVHSAASTSLIVNATNALLCQSCHSSGKSANNFALSDVMQATPGVNGTSHRWDAAMPATNNANNQYGLRPTANLTNAALIGQLSNLGTIQCSVCHNQHSQSRTPFDALSSVNYTQDSTNNRHFMRINNMYNEICEDCHYYRRAGSSQTNTTVWQGGNYTSHPVGEIFSSAGGETPTVRDSSQYNVAPKEPSTAGWANQTGARYQTNGGTDTNADNNIVVDDTKNIRCLSCHGMHFTDSNTTTIDNVTYMGTGNGYLLRRSRSDLCHGCHKTDSNSPGDSNAIKTHNSQTTGSSKWGSNWGVNSTSKYGAIVCTTCHTAHTTPNVYLTENNIITPDGSNFTGRTQNNVSVDFRYKSDQTTGTTGTMGDDSTTHSTSNRICEACHTYDSNSTNGVKYHAYNMTNITTHNNAKDCTGCHSHRSAFKAGESGGGTDCDTCHNSFYSQMNTTAGGYHHYLNNAWSNGTGKGAGGTTYPVLTSQMNVFGSGNPTTSTDRRCLVCHVDHNIFSPNVNPTNGGRGKNLRVDITATPTTTANFTNTDYDNSNTYGGICLSCHGYQQGKWATQPDSTTVTPAIAKADYGTSSHNYTAMATFNDAYTNNFTANCSKCHNDTLTKNYQQSALPNQFSNHNSSVRRITAGLNMTSPTDPVEEDLCFRCHSKTTDTNPGGYPAKVVAGKDFYNATAMGTNAEELFSDFRQSSGTATSASTTVLNDTTQAWAANQFNAYYLTLLNGTYAGQTRRITATSATSVTVSSAFGGSPVAGTQYRIGGRHMVDDSSMAGRHQPIEGQSSGWMTSANRHVECEDCHNPHTAAGGVSHVDSGTATAGATSNLQDTNQSWAANRWQYYEISIISGTGAGQTRFIQSNTNNNITIVGNWSTNPASGSVYKMISSTFATGGVTTGGSATTLVDSAQNWGSNVWQNYYVITRKPSSDWGAVQVGRITSNTATTLTVAAGSWTTPDTGVQYIIYQVPALAGVNYGVKDTISANFTSGAPTNSTRYSSKSTAATQYELCLTCHSQWAWGNGASSINIPTRYPTAYDQYNANLTETDVGTDFNVDQYAYHPLFAPGKNQPIRMGNPQGSTVSNTTAYNANWPNYSTGNITVTNTTISVTGSGGASFPAGVGAGWWIFVGNATPTNPATAAWVGTNKGWWPIASRNTATSITLAVPYSGANVTNGKYYITKGLKATFNEGWGPESLVTCTDCHNTTGTSYANGPHGSANRWMLRNQEVQQFTADTAGTVTSTTVTNMLNYCLNCHSTNVYGDASIGGSSGSSGANVAYSRNSGSHPDNGADYRSSSGGNFYQIPCYNCHAGASSATGQNAGAGVVHGSSAGVGTYGSSPRGFRFMNGSAWNGHTAGLTTSNCITASASSSINGCNSHSNSSGTQTGTHSYQY